MYVLLFLAVATSFFGAQIFVIDLIFFKLSLFRVSLLLAPILYFLTLLRNDRSVFLLPEGRNRYSLQFMYFWLAYSIMSLAWVQDVGSGLRNLYFLMAGIAFIYLFSVKFRQKHHFVMAFNVMNFMIFIHNVIGWYEILFRRYHFLSNELRVYYLYLPDRLPISMLGNPNDFALLMLFGFAISMACMRMNTSRWLKIFSGGIMISSFVLIFATKSRANILGLFIIMLIVVFRAKKMKYLLLSLFSIGMVVLIFKYPSLIKQMFDKVYVLLTFGFSSTSQTSDFIRVNLIRNGFYFLYKTLGFGTGVGNIEYWMQSSALYSTENVTNIHNWWMEILVGYGILTFVLYIKFYFRLLKDMYVSFNNDDHEMKAISFSIFIIMVGFIVASLSSSSNINKEWLWIFWAVTISYQGFVSMHHGEALESVEPINREINCIGGC